MIRKIFPVLLVLLHVTTVSYADDLSDDSFDAPAPKAASPICGQTGDTTARIADCAATLKGWAHQSFGEGKKTFTWDLVSQDAAGIQSWRDTTTGTIWIPANHGEMTLDQAKAYCASQTWNGSPTDLPAISDYKAASAHHILGVYTNMNSDLYWSKTSAGDDRAYCYDGFGDDTDMSDYAMFPKVFNCIGK